MKVCLITSAKDEDNHIEEFLEHYLDIVGVDHIFWIDNNTEPLKPVVINDDRVTVIDKRHVNFDSGDKKPLFIMRDLLNDVYQEHIVGSEYDWCCYFDPDELLELPCDIKTYLQEKEEYDVILCPWVMHGNNNYIFESELPSDRMKVNYGYEDNYRKTRVELKPIFRTKPEFKMDVFFYNKERIIRNCDVEKIFVDSDVKLHHYRIQCIETYIKHKVQNGFYGQTNKDNWCKNLFKSSQFSTSNVVISKKRRKDFLMLLRQYNINKVVSNDDRLYLLFKYNIMV